MPLSRDVLAAIGGVAIETTWVEYQIARLVVMARKMESADREDYMRLLLSKRIDLDAARAAAGQLRDPNVATRTLAWLDEAESLRNDRHSLIHSIVMDEHRPGYTGYWPRDKKVVTFDAAQVVDLENRVRVHGQEGDAMSLFDWPAALGLVDTRDVDE